jgi:NAD(P)-dependent dehydrogenase (short-subunit alcohol dehydrogenase family)
MKDQRWGRIVNTTARAWISAHVGAPNYAAAMAGIVGLTGDVARDIGKYGVTCNAYSPFSKTRRTGVAKFKKEFEAGEISKEDYERHPDKPAPEESAPFITYLCSEHAANINGKILGIRRGEICVFSHPVEEKVIRKTRSLWTHEELVAMVPDVLPDGYVNPVPPW